MTLKHVVLPAPLGPMSPRISPLLMWKLTSLRATTPPKRSVTASTSRRRSPSGTTGTPMSSGAMSTSGLISVTSSAGSASALWPAGSRALVGRVVSDTGLSFLEDGLSVVRALGAHGPPRGKQSLRAEDREEHQGQTEDEHAEVGELTEALREVAHDDRADNDAPAVAGAADHDGGEEQDREQQLEALRVDEPGLGREERTREATDGSAEREREQLEPEGRHAHQLRGVLVLARGLPGAADPAALDEDVEEQNEADDAEREPVVRDEVVDPELQERGGGVQVDDRRTAAPVDAGHLEHHDARRLRDVADPLGATEPLEVDQREPDDLTEAERHDGEVVAADAQRRGTEDEARDHGDHDRDRHDDEPAELRVLGGQDADGVGADGVEADVAEVEQACVADDDVEAEGDEDVGRDGEEHAAEVGALGRDEGDVQQRQHEQEDREEHPEQDLDGPWQVVHPLPEPGRRRPASGFGDGGAHARAFPRDSPSRPVGRKSRIRISRTNATTSFHWVPTIADP